MLKQSFKFAITILFILAIGGLSVPPEPVQFTSSPQVFYNPSNLPHLFLDLRAPKETLERIIEVNNLFSSYLIPSARRFGKFSNLHPSFRFVLEDKEVKVLFLDWIELELRGEKVLKYNPPNQLPQLFPQNELEKLKRKLTQDIKIALNELWKILEPENIEASILDKLVKIYGFEKRKLLEELDKEIQIENYQVKVREILQIPKFEKKDFLPDLIIVGELPFGILGAATLSLEGAKRVVFYSPLGWRFDFIMGKPYILMHELVHANTQIQALPLVYYFHAEMFAELSMLMADIYPFELFFHGYLEPVRRAVWNYFSFDVREAAKQIFSFSTARVYTIDEEKFRKFHIMVQEIAKELKRFVKERLYPEFYSHPLYWVAFNTKLCQSYAFFDLFMGLEYEPTILDGAENTKKFLLKHEKVILEIAKKALKKAGEKKETPEKLEEELSGFSFCPQDLVWWPVHVFPPGKAKELINSLSWQELKLFLEEAFNLFEGGDSR